MRDDDEGVVDDDDDDEGVVDDDDDDDCHSQLIGLFKHYTYMASQPTIALYMFNR